MGRSRRSLVVAFALAGLILVAGVTYLASRLVSQPIGLTSEPATFGESLAPVRAPAGSTTTTAPPVTTTVTTTTTVPATTPTVPPASTTTVPPATTPSGDDDDHGGGHDDDDD